MLNVSQSDGGILVQRRWQCDRMGRVHASGQTAVQCVVWWAVLRSDSRRHVVVLWVTNTWRLTITNLTFPSYVHCNCFCLLFRKVHVMVWQKSAGTALCIVRCHFLFTCRVLRGDSAVFCSLMRYRCSLNEVHPVLWSRHCEDSDNGTHVYLL